jgi:sugar lactone lactonase YvrE
MKIKRILRCIAFSLVAAFGVATLAQAQAPGGGGQPDPRTLTETQIASIDVPNVLYRLAAIYKQAGDAERLGWSLQRLVTLLPGNGDLRLSLAGLYAQEGNSSKAYDTLLRMQRQGFGYDLEGNALFAKIANTKVWTYIVDSFKKNLAPFGEGKVAFTLPKGDYLFESLAWDPKRKAFLVGSVRDGKISIADKAGKLTDFIVPDAENGLWSVYAMAADLAHDALYVASTSSVYYKNFKQDDFGKAGLFKFKLSTGKLVDKHLLTPDRNPRTLSSVAVGKDGQVFAADGLRNIIYRLDGGVLKPMVENPKLTSIRGLAVSADGKRLYFADYSLGVFGIDLAAGKGFDLQYPDTQLVLGGVDGLYAYGDDALVAIENGMSPKRVMRLRLDADGRKVVKAMPIDSANPAFGLPTYGAIDGDGLYFVANSQKNDYDKYGAPKDASKLEAVKVFRSDLRFAWDDTTGVNQKLPPLPGMNRDAAKPAGAFDNVDGGAATTAPSGG